MGSEIVSPFMSLIQQGCIKLTKRYSEDFYTDTKDFDFKEKLLFWTFYSSPSKKRQQLFSTLIIIRNVSWAANHHMWPWTTKPVIRVFFIYWDLYIIWKLNKYIFHWCMVYDRTIFGWDATIWTSGIWGCKKNYKLRKSPLKLSKLNFLQCILQIKNEVLIYLQ